MKKNLFFGLLTVASMLFATSCTNDNLDVAQSGDEVQVSFQLGLEEGMGSRAISDGTGADKLVYAVFDDQGNVVVAKTEKTDVEYPVTESITLPKGKTFKVAFWAQDADCTAYTVNDDMTVTVDYANATNNDETRDAFFQTVEVTVTGSTALNVNLKRPFAQINVGVPEVDWEVAEQTSSTFGKSSMTIKNVATSLNLLNGKVDGTAEVTYALGDIPTESEKLAVDTDGDGTKENYVWLSMSYILPADATTGSAKTTLDALSFAFGDDANASQITLSEGLTNVPVQRNWRTNIIANLFTGNITFNIAVDPAYEGDAVAASIGGTSYNTLAAAIEAAQDGETVMVEANADLQETTTQDYLYLIDKKVTIDLNGNDIVANKTIFKVVDGGELTIKGKGNIQVENSIAETVIICNESGTVNFEGGTLKGSGVVYNKKVNETAVAGTIYFRGSKFIDVEIADDFATKVTDNSELAAAISNPDVSTIILSAAGTYDITYSTNKNSLTIIGTEGVKIQFTGSNVLASNYKQYTIHNCEILKMKTKSWGMVVHGGTGKVNGVYTISNCVFNGVETQGIYYNESTSGVIYNVVACTFIGKFGNEGAVTIQNNKPADGGKVIFNVFGCDFSNIDGSSPKISYHYAYNVDYLEINTDLNEEDVVCLNKL